MRQSRAYSPANRVGSAPEIIARASIAVNHRPPLCVHLDGTLILNDLVLEWLVLFFKRNPFYLLLVPFWLLEDRALLKVKETSRVTLKPEAFSSDRELIHWLESERSVGRSRSLSSASNNLLAAHVASHFGLFEGVLANARNAHPTGTANAVAFVKRFGERGFDHRGNEPRDCPIWKLACGAIVVRGGRQLEWDQASLLVLVRFRPAQTHWERYSTNVLNLPHEFRSRPT